MLNEQTLQIMRQLKLFGMARGFEERLGRSETAELSHEEVVGLLVDDERVHRENARVTRLRKRAHLKQAASQEDVDYRHPRSLEKPVMVELLRGHWLTKCQNILITGPTGIGKSWLACALGDMACRMGHTTLYLRFPRLLENLYASRADGSHLKLLNRLAKVQVLILDDFGLTPLTDLERKDLLEIVEDRYGSGSTILTSQPPTKSWHAIIGEPTIADAVCDRLFHDAYRLDLKGDSIRKKRKT